jgi:hypothetical protein
MDSSRRSIGKTSSHEASRPDTILDQPQRRRDALELTETPQVLSLAHNPGEGPGEIENSNGWQDFRLKASRRSLVARSGHENYNPIIASISSAQWSNIRSRAI